MPESTPTLYIANVGVDSGMAGCFKLLSIVLSNSLIHTENTKIRCIAQTTYGLDRISQKHHT